MQFKEALEEKSHDIVFHFCFSLFDNDLAHQIHTFLCGNWTTDRVNTKSTNHF